MRNKVKYKVSCGGSGWGVWSVLTGEKVAWRRNRIEALEKMYELNGWNKPTKWY